MLCDICHINEAVIHIQEINNGEKKLIHICQECAAKKNIKDIGFIKGVDIAEILYKLSMQGNDNNILQSPIEIKPAAEKKEEKVNPKFKLIPVCRKCGWDEEKFKKTGRLGCENCYNMFADILTKTLSNIHKGTQHKGKGPSNLNSSETNFILLEINSLQRQLEDCIKKEQYEKAAAIRDKIAELRKKDKKKNGKKG